MSRERLIDQYTGTYVRTLGLRTEQTNTRRKWVCNIAQPLQETAQSPRRPHRSRRFPGPRRRPVSESGLGLLPDADQSIGCNKDTDPIS